MTDFTGKHRRQDMKTAMCERMPPRQINEAFLISLRNKFVYTRVPKVANSSLKHLVYSMEKPSWAGPVRDNLIHESQYGPLIRSEMLGLASPLFHRALFSGNFFRFTFVRNPYAKALSTYLDRYMSKHSTVRRLVNEIALKNDWVPSEDENVTFSEFLRAVEEMPPWHMEPHISPQYIQTLSELVTYSYIGSFETLVEDTQYVAKRIWGRDDVELGFKSPSRTNAITRLHEMCSDADIALINRLYERDFQVFGYQMVNRVADFEDDSAMQRVQTEV